VAFAHIVQYQGIPALQAEIDDSQPKVAQCGKFIVGFAKNSFGIGVDSNSLNPRHFFPYTGQYPDEPLLRDNQGVTVDQKNPAKKAEVVGSVIDVRIDYGVVFYGEPLFLVSAAKGALVVGTPEGNLEQ
jgi:hypothetical protein